jgi:hypothetical protein
VDAYEIVQDVYRVPGGYGRGGEIFGGILLHDDPGIVIGASGRMKFVNRLKEAIGELNLSENLRIYLTSVTIEEIITLELIRKHIPDAQFYIHEDIAKKIQNPRKLYFDKRFDPLAKSAVERFSNKLPKQIDNIIQINKLSSFETKKTKILIVPFSGPHEGHTFIYSRDHRLLCSGLVLGYTPSNSRAYYLDFTGSLFNYANAFSFLNQAQADIIAPAYDEPQFTKTSPISTIAVSTAIESDKAAAYDLCSLQWRSFPDILQEYRQIYDSSINTYPYDEIRIDATILRFHLSELVKDSKIVEDNFKYKRV